MGSTTWLAFTLVLVSEGLGSMLYPKAWEKIVPATTNLSNNILRHFGGGLVIAGVMVYYMLKKTIS